MCLWPRKPWRIRIQRDGFEHVIRCGECPGCLEFERRRLAERLHAKYGATDGEPRSTTAFPDAKVGSHHRGDRSRLSIVRIFAPIELHASMSHALHRRRGIEFEPGFYRLGATSFALIARATAPPRAWLKRSGLKYRIEPVRLRRGRRAWRPLTAGLMVAREIYGEQRNRYYARGLPKTERLKWEVRTIDQYASYSRYRSPRADIGRKLVLMPPEVWRLSRTDRRSLRGRLLRASDPEGVAKVMGLIADTLRNAGRKLLVSAAAKPLLTREQVAGWYKQMAERKEARTALPGSDSSITPISEMGGYVSSEHTQGELMPLELTRAREKEVREARKRRAIKESMEIIERMRQRSKGER